LATDNDAALLREVGIPVVQITTGTVCHLDAEMVSKAAAQLDLDQLDILVIENVGNLVCPADYDLGEDLRVVLLSTTEGEDKPLKYPPMFHSANVVIVTKSDLGVAAGFNREQALTNLKRISHHAEIFELSSKTAEGMKAWLEFLVKRRSS
jgi:hydrogenase nickel incorporation protein HypB